jgi:hypothetical protein
MEHLVVVYSGHHYLACDSMGSTRSSYSHIFFYEISSLIFRCHASARLFPPMCISSSDVVLPRTNPTPKPRMHDDDSESILSSNTSHVSARYPA